MNIAGPVNTPWQDEIKCAGEEGGFLNERGKEPVRRRRVSAFLKDFPMHTSEHIVFKINEFRKKNYQQNITCTLMRNNKGLESYINIKVSI